MTQKIYDRLRNSIDDFNKNWRNGILHEIKCKLPILVENKKEHTICEAKVKNEEVHIRFFNGLYSKWKKVEHSDEIVFNDVNYKIMWIR